MWAGKYFIQTADINASETKSWNDGAGFLPIGSRTTNFSGHYHGKGHVISGLYIDRARVDVGLFGHLFGATVDSLGVLNAYVSLKGQEVAGILAGYNNDGSTISNSFSSGTLVGAKFAGGLVGKDLKSHIYRSYSTANVSGGQYVGGLLGETNGSTIANAYSTGTVTGKTEVGGLIGHIYSASSVSHSYSTGRVLADSYAGGLFGNVANEDFVHDCYWDVETSGLTTSAGGTGLTTEQMKTVGNFARWDFDATWSTRGNTTYPLLQTVFNMYDMPYAFDDTLFAPLARISLAKVLVNDAGYETDPSTMVYKIITQTPSAGTVEDGYYTFTTADSAATETLVYRVGRFIADGDTMWSTQAAVTLEKGIRGNGTEEDPYEISTLQLLRNVSEDNSVWGSHFIQTADIDASETKDWNASAGFSPIGRSSYYFTGTYNGKGHTISHLFIHKGTTKTALFGEASHATFDSLGLVDVDIAGDYYTGALLAMGSSVSIFDCYSTGSVTGAAYTGGLVGNFQSKNSSILRSYNLATVFGSSPVGGLVGANEGAITKCYNRGSVFGGSNVGGLVGSNTFSKFIESYNTGNVSGERFVGGLVGGAVSSTVSLCYATGALTATSKSAGGLVGSMMGSSVSSSYSTGSVSGVHRVGGLVGSQEENASVASSISGCYSTGLVSGMDTVGAFIGYNDASSTVSGSYWNTETSGQSAAIGLDRNSQSVTGLTTEKLRTRSALSVYDFIHTWSLRADSTYPVLDSVSNNAPFAFADDIETTAPISLNSLLANDWDYETLQASLTWRLLSVTENHGSMSPAGVFTFDAGTTYGDADTLVYRVGEVIAEGDTLWGNNARAIFVYKNNTPVLSSVSDSIVIKLGDTFTPSLDDVSAEDADGDALSLELYSGENYTIDAGTVVPDVDYSGTLNVGVAVTDGGATSSRGTMVILVDAVPEVSSAIADIKTKEDSELEAVSLTSVFSDANDAVPSYTAKSSDTTLLKTGVSKSGVLSLTLRPDSSGSATVIVTATDGHFSVADTFAVKVAAVNDAPVITSVKKDTTDKNKSLLLTMKILTATDVDNDSKDLSLVVKSGKNYSVKGDTVIPAKDYTGTLKVAVVVTDGRDTSATDTVQVYVAKTQAIASASPSVSLNRLSAWLTGGTLQLSYSLSHAANVSIAFYSVSGARVLLLHKGPQQAGLHGFVTASSELSSGLYEGVLFLNGSPAAHTEVTIQH